MATDESQIATESDVKRIITQAMKPIGSRLDAVEGRTANLENTTQRIGVLLEELITRNDLIIEIVSDLQQQIRLCAKQTDLDEVKRDIKTMKLALALTNRQVHNHEGRIRKLESSQVTV